MYSSSGAHFGELAINDKTLTMKHGDDKTSFKVKLDNLAQCVLPQNRNELELQFQENDNAARDEDCLVQMTFHFPEKEIKEKEGDDNEGESEEEDEQTNAEIFQKSVLDTGVIKTLTSNIIVEFSRDMGTFVTPRGKYLIQMTSTYMRMAGAQYDYKILYSDIQSLFLLPKPDGTRMAFVISLAKPIRQGNQKYQHLVLETHKLEDTVQVNLSEEEIAEKYDGQLQREMTMPTCNLVAKVFKVLSQNTVFIPKTFVSVRETHCVKCSLKANDGLLYPLAKSFVFIHKPTLIIKFEDVEYVEFQRYKVAANAATKNFDVLLRLRADAVKTTLGEAAGSREYLFMGIERNEFPNLHEFFMTKKMAIKGVEEGSHMAAESDDEQKQNLQLSDADEDSEDDGDYGGGSGSESGSGSDSEDGSGGSDNEGEAAVKEEKKSRKEKTGKKDRGEEKESKKKSKKREAASPEPAKKVKDKNAPKAAKNAYRFFMDEAWAKLKGADSELSFGELNKQAGAQWKELSAEEKMPYEEMAARDTERYKAEMKDYVPPAGAAAGGPAKRAKKDENAPKNPLSSYILFTGDCRASITRAHPEWPVSEVAKEMGVRWKALSAEERAVYEDMAKADKKRYEAQMAEYKAEGSFTAAAKPLSVDFGGTGPDAGSSSADASAAAAPMEVQADSESAEVEEPTQAVE